MIHIPQAKSAEELRSLIRHELSVREIAWVDLRGLSIHNVRYHAALMRSLAGLGFDPELQRALPRAVVLDWSSVDTVCAEGLAFFSALAQHLLELDVNVVACCASCADISEALRASGIRSFPKAVKWVPEPTTPSHRIIAICRAAVLRGSDGRKHGARFVLDLEGSLQRLGVDANAAALINAVALELLQNVLEHSGEVSATAVALLQQRRRPPVVQIGVGDMGAGIAENVLNEARHHDLGSFTDLTVVEAVFAAALSGRAADSGGGGLSRLVKDIVNRYGGEAWIRSGAGLIGFTKKGQKGAGIHLNEGFGTQVRISVPTR